MKRIILMLTVAVLMVAAMAATAPLAFAAPADPHRNAKAGPGDDGGADQPGTCTETTQKGANVTTTTHKGNCDSNGGQETGPTPSKNPPGGDK